MKILTLAIAAAVYLLPTQAFTQKELTNELIWYSGEFSGEYVSGGNSMNDGKHYTAIVSAGDDRSIVKYAYETGDSLGIVLRESEIFKDREGGMDSYSFSSDESMLLISSNYEQIYRRSSRANYTLVDLKTKKSMRIADFSKGKQRLATFSPDGKKVAFVRKNNIFIYDISTGKEMQVSTDGVINEVINGATDWVYEEEFGFTKGIYWSPNSDRLAFYRFDESQVKEFQMAMYGPLYPEQYTFKYPKAGEDNAVVSIHVHDLASKKTRKVNTGENTDIYFPRIKWTQSNDGLCVMRLNRHQNHLEFLLTDLSTKSLGEIPTYTMYEEKAKTYVEVNDNLIFLEDGKSFLWNSQKDGYNHIYRLPVHKGKQIQLTSGKWDVIEFIGVNEKRGAVYFSSAEISALEKHIYSVDLKGRKKKRLTQRSGQNDATFSSTYDYFINTNTSANVPAYITLHNGTGKLIKTLKDNQALRETLAEYGLGSKEFFTFENSNGDDLHAWMIKPKDFDPNKTYPVYVNIYGGPGHNTVSNGWEGRNYLWHQLLAQKGYIVASVDPRGTMYRGRDFNHSTYLQMGKLETEDFIDFAKYLGDQSYVDASRIGMQGWSYGGYMTSLCLTKGADVYKAGIAVAPVTNWRYYDSIYTERFMRTPQENPDGYDDNSPIFHVDKLKGPFLLVHGSADDNVHYQNTMEMVNAFVKANKQFDLFIYPDRNHGIYGGTTRLHLFNKMLKFVEENL